MRRMLLFTLVLALVLTVGCGKQNAGEEPSPSTGDPKPTSMQSDEEMFTKRDKDIQYSPQNAVRIQLNGSTAEATSDSVRIDGSSITITEEGTYLLSGTLEDGTIVIDSNEKAKLQLVLEEVVVHSTTSALEVREADKVFVTLADGTENVLSGDGAEGAVISRQDMTVNGSGALRIHAQGGHGIVCKDDLVFTGGCYQIQSASHGLDVNDSVRITGNTELTLEAGKDGIHCENKDDAEKGFVYIEKGNLKITAEGDGISAGAYARILGGTFETTAGGGSINGTKEHSDFFGGFPGNSKPGRPRAADQTVSEDATSMKGLKAAGDVVIADGTFVMDTADDCIHSNTSIGVGGGTFELSSGDDAFHAEETLTIDAGVVNIKTSYEALEAHKVYIRGGQLELHAKDDGINAAGGKDSSGTGGGRDGMFAAAPNGGMGGRPGGPMGGGSSDGVIEISGGNVNIYASGDGLDANGTVLISDGHIYVTNPSAGDTSVLDSDRDAKITGGTFISAGASTMMAQSFSSDSTQGVIACTVGSQPAGTPVSVLDEEGTVLVSYEAQYNFVLVIISTPELRKGETYTLNIGETSGSIQAS